MLDLEIEVEETGDPASHRRAQMAGSNDPRRFARWLQATFPSAELVGEPVFDPRGGIDPSRLEIVGTVPRAALRTGGGISTYPGDLGLVGRITPTAQRQSPLYLPVGPVTAWQLLVNLDRAPQELPASVQLTTRFGYLSLDIEASEKGYQVDGEFTLHSTLVTKEEFGELRDFLIAVERHLSRPLEVP